MLWARGGPPARLLNANSADVCSGSGGAGADTFSPGTGALTGRFPVEWRQCALLEGETTMGLTSTLFRLARLSADAKAVASGKPKKVGRRAKNKALGRLMAKGGVWRKLFGGR